MIISGMFPPSLSRLLVVIFTLGLIAACGPRIVKTTTPATLIESDGPSAGSLVTITVDHDNPIPPVGAIGTLRVIHKAGDKSFVGLPLSNVTIGLSAGRVEVVNVSNRSVTVRIIEPGVTKANEAVDLLKEPGSSLEFEWLPPPK